MIRFRIIASCDHPGCTRATEATARLEFGHGMVMSLDGKISGRVSPGLRDIVFAQMPSISTTPRLWTERDGRVFCPEHAKETA